MTRGVVVAEWDAAATVAYVTAASGAHPTLEAKKSCKIEHFCAKSSYFLSDSSSLVCIWQSTQVDDSEMISSVKKVAYLTLP